MCVLNCACVYVHACAIACVYSRVINLREGERVRGGYEIMIWLCFVTASNSIGKPRACAHLQKSSISEVNAVVKCAGCHTAPVRVNSSSAKTTSPDMAASRIRCTSSSPQIDMPDMPWSRHHRSDGARNCEILYALLKNATISSVLFEKWDIRKSITRESVVSCAA